MKKFSLGKKKSIVLLVALLVVGAAGAGYWFYYRPNHSTSDSLPLATPKKVASIEEYIKTDKAASTFQAITADVAVTNASGGEKPMLMIFAPLNKAFEGDELKSFSSLDTTAQAEIKQYHYVTMAMAGASKGLSDGMHLNTMAGRELLVKTDGANTYLIDTKGRMAKVSKAYVDDQAGNRLYYIDNVMLIQ